METNKMKGTGYTAPKLEAASFKTEQGYAVSEPAMSTTAKITMGGASL